MNHFNRTEFRLGGVELLLRITSWTVLAKAILACHPLPTLHTMFERARKNSLLGSSGPRLLGATAPQGHLSIFITINRTMRLSMAINVTPEAADQLKRAHSEAQFGDETFVRVGVVAGGCSGFEYSLNFDDKFDEAKDTRVEQNGVAVVIDRKSALLLEGTTLGWFSSLERQGFTFENPNAVKSCGCGRSFQ